MDRVLKASYILDASGVSRGVKDAEGSLGTLDSRSKTLADSFDHETSRMGGMFSNLAQTMRNNGVPFSGAFAKIGEDLDQAKSHAAGYGQVLSDVGRVAAVGFAAGLGVAAVESVKMATTFQTSMTELVTGAGESQANLKMVSKGILNMAGPVGETTQQLASGMYLVESSGEHGAAGLQVLKAAAEGAKVGGADLGTVANALTTALHDYHLPASQATQVTSALVQTVASGKMHMEDLARSLGRVMPQAATLGVSFAQVTGAMATMTNAGLSARLAARALNNTILAISAPSATAEKAMKNVGLSAQQVKDTLGHEGLTAAVQLVEEHVGHTFPAGSVASVTAFKNIIGGAVGYSTALMLGGKNMSTFESNVTSIGQRLQGSGKQVQGFTLVQKDLGFQIDSLKASVEAEAIRFGTFLIPKLQLAAHVTADLIGWVTKHKAAEVALGVAVGGPVALAIGAHMVLSLKKMGGELVEASKLVRTFGKGLLDLGPKLLNAGSSVASFVAGQAAQLATSGRAVVVWMAEHTAAAATFIAENVAMAASATVAFIAENAATLGIVAGLAALVGGVVYVATHWKQVWHDIVQWVGDAKTFIVAHVHEIAAGLAVLLPGIGLVMAAGLELATHWKQVAGVLTAVWHNVDTVARNVWGGIESFLKNTWHAIVTVFEDATIVGLLYSHWSAIESGVQSMWHQVTGIFQQMWRDIVHGVGTFLAEMTQGFEGLVNGVFWMVEQVLGAASHLPFIGKHFAAAEAEVKGFQQNVDSTLAGVAQSMQSWGETSGRNLSTGLAQGMNYAAAAAAQSAQSVAASVEGAMRKGLQVHSPSRLSMAMGVDWSKGLELGIDAGAPGAKNAAAGLLGGLPTPKAPTAPLAAAGPGAANGAAAAPAGPTTINVYVTIEGQVLDGAQLARTLGPDIRRVLMDVSRTSGTSMLTL